MWQVIAIGIECIVALYLTCVALRNINILKEKENNAEIKTLQDLRKQDQLNNMHILNVSNKVILALQRIEDITTENYSSNKKVEDIKKELLSFKQQLKRKI